MTREELLACLEDRPCNVCEFHTEEGCNKWSCVFEEEPEEPSGDLISRQAVLDIVDSYSVSQSNVEDVTQDIISDIVVLPSVNPQEPKYCDRNICVSNEYNGIGCDECEVTKSQEPKTGHWLESKDKDFYKCSECECHWEKGLVENCNMDYCPNCGCAMKGE